MAKKQPPVQPPRQGSKQPSKDVDGGDTRPRQGTLKSPPRPSRQNLEDLEQRETWFRSRRSHAKK